MRTERLYIADDDTVFTDMASCVEYEAEQTLAGFLAKRQGYSSEELARALRLCFHMAAKREDQGK